MAKDYISNSFKLQIGTLLSKVFLKCYYLIVIITKSEPFTKDEIKKLRELFDGYIKTVIDVNKKICSAGCDRHFESEKILLDDDSHQLDVWGGGVDLETKIIDCNSFINVRPSDNNTSNEIQDQKLRKRFEDLTKYFFKEVL
jgi:hypothetical protein